MFNDYPAIFKEYESKPITRRAYQVQSVAEVLSTGVPNRSILRVTDHADVLFAHYEPVAVGDWIVYLKGDDVYHCTDAVFRERNIVN